MRGIIEVRLPRGDEYWRPGSMPGSPMSIDSGCRCPVDQPWPGGFRFSTDCPIHRLQLAGRRNDDGIPVCG